MNNAGEEKITERVLYKRLAVSISIIILCMFAMSLSAYACFTSTVQSGKSEIVGASYELDILVDGAAPEDKTVILGGGEHTVTLSKSAASTATTGFCRITVDETQYYTQQIGADINSSDPRDNITIRISVPYGKRVEVQLASSWGTSVFYGAESEQLLYDGDVITVQ